MSDVTSPTVKPPRHGLVRPRQLLVLAAATAPLLVLGWVTFEFALAGAVSSAGVAAERRLALFDRTLEAMIERFHYLPAAIAQAEEIHAALARPGEPGIQNLANGFLSKLNETAGADELFIMDRKGSVAAASNWWTLDSLVGRDFSFRPYFAEAMLDGTAQFYAFGIATSVPGYFLSQRIDGPDGPEGVAVTKINLGEIEANWWRSGELIGIVDVNNVVILSTRPDWRYRPLVTIEEALAAKTTGDQRYGDVGILNQGIVTDIWPSRGAQFAYIDGPDPEAAGYFTLNELRLPTHGWRLVSFTPVAPLFRGAWIAAAAAALAAAAVILIAALLWQRQRIVAARLADHERLEQRVAERTEDLHITNDQLRAEIAERQRAEQDSRDAQAGLVQAAKLASLGQALAGVAHEISQPVAALTTHIASAKLLVKRGEPAQVGGILVTMDNVLSRLSALTGHLKTFARKETDISIITDLVQIVHNALELSEHKLRSFDVTVLFAPPAGPLYVQGNPIHLEQVLINLISNAADAMEDRPERVLRVTVETLDDVVRLELADTGTGIDSDLANTLFDPFVTTKGPGRGLGLGLSISYGLVKAMRGSITVTTTKDVGSTFILTLPLVSQLRDNSTEIPA